MLSKHVEHLLLYLLKLIFHLHHDPLHVGIAALGSESIDLAPHFLSYESELLPLPCFRTRSVGLSEGVHKVVEMRTQT